MVKNFFIKNIPEADSFINNDYQTLNRDDTDSTETLTKKSQKGQLPTHFDANNTLLLTPDHGSTRKLQTKILHTHSAETGGAMDMPGPWVYMLSRMKTGQALVRELQDVKHKSKQKQEQAQRLSD